MSQLVEKLERELSVIARNLREPVVLADGRIVRRTTVSLLYLLADVEPVRLGAVAAALNVDPSTTTRQVQYVRGLGLVEQIEDPQDRRANLLSRTQAGRDMYDSLVEQQRRGLLHILDDWPGRDQDDLVRLLSSFNAKVARLQAAAPTTPNAL